MTVLKIGFAMGGGVSLGTFSAGALAQSIKLAILYGKDRNGAPYDTVEIDVFSGASAGSISLAIMLRALVAQDEAQVESAIEALNEEYPGSDLLALQEQFPSKWKALVAAQVMQHVQNQIWVKRVTMDDLLNPEADTVPPNPDFLKYTPGILNRAYLEELAADQINSLPQITKDDEQKLLAKRVLFASSLTNITSINHDARGQFNAAEGSRAALSEGMNSEVHRESRVFDFHFNDSVSIEELKNNNSLYPDRWIRYHLNDNEQDVIGQLHDNDDVWYRVFATSIACGAFPTAFEPVVLERYRYEFANTWPKELRGKSSFNFTYFDGGTFNNEPIRDAFRLASFIDANDQSTRSFERAMFFVDPAVEEVKTNLNVEVHRQFSLSNPLFGDNAIGDIDGVDLVRKTSFDRLLPQVRDILLSLFRQSRSIEGDKIFKVRKKFQERTSARIALTTSAPETVTTSALKALIKHLKQIQKNADKNALFPRAALNLEGEIKRILREEADLFDEFNEKNISQDIEAIVRGTEPSNDNSQWYLILLFLMVDEAMDLIGKTDHIDFYAIAPFDFRGQKPVKVKLEGDLFQAFGGFMSEDARETDMAIGSWCARQALVKGSMISAAQNNAITPRDIPKLKNRDKYILQVEKGVKDLTNRIVTMIDRSHIPILSSIPKVLLKLIIKRFLKYEDIEPCTANLPKEVELWIKVPSKHYELDGRGRVPLVGDKDIKPVSIDNSLYLITTAKSNDKCELVGEHIEHNVIPIDKFNIKRGHLALPKKQQLREIKKHPYAYLLFDLDVDQRLSNGRFIGEWQVMTPLIPLHHQLEQLAHHRQANLGENQ